MILVMLNQRWMFKKIIQKKKKKKKKGKTYILGEVDQFLFFKNCHVIFGECYVEIICSICTSRKFSNQLEEEKEREREREGRKSKTGKNIGEKRIEERQGEGERKRRELNKRNELK